MSTTVGYRYITSVPNILSGEPIIKGTRTPVRSIVLKWRLGYSPEEMIQAMPYLTLAEVFEALSYYSDNSEEIDDYIDRNHIPEELIHPLVRDLGP